MLVADRSVSTHEECSPDETHCDCPSDAILLEIIVFTNVQFVQVCSVVDIALLLICARKIVEIIQFLSELVIETVVSLRIMCVLMYT